MTVFVYKSERKDDTYLYLVERDDFSKIPAVLQTPLVPWQFVLQFELHPNRKLPRVSAEVLQRNLVAQGYYLQATQTVLDPLVAGGVGDG